MRGAAKMVRPSWAATGLRAGTLNRKVSLQRKTGKDAYGQPSDTWTEYASVWGAVLQLNGKEHLGANTVVDVSSASIRVRFRQDVVAGDRAVCQGQAFHIANVLSNVATREYTDLICTENANQG